MAENSNLVDDYEDPEDQNQPKPLPAHTISRAADARRRLETYWADKALQEQLKDLDDWDQGD